MSWYFPLGTAVFFDWYFSCVLLQLSGNSSFSSRFSCILRLYLTMKWLSLVDCGEYPQRNPHNRGHDKKAGHDMVCVLLRAVETNWEISSQSSAIRYSTGFKPFYFHRGRITLQSPPWLSSSENSTHASPQGGFQWCCQWRLPTRPSSRSREQSKWSTQRKWSGRTFALQKDNCQINAFDES